MYRRTLGLPHHSTTSIRTVAAPGVPKAHRLVLGRRLLLLSTLLTMFAGGQAVHPTSALAGNGTWPSSTITTRVGGDYVDPSAQLYSNTTPFLDPNPPTAGATTTCSSQHNAHSNADWSWLQPQCWNPSGYSITAKSQLMTELGYITQHRLGTFQRVWVSMDQLGSFSGTTFTLNQAIVGGTPSNNPGTLLQALQVYHDFGIQVDLVLFTYSPNGNCGAAGNQNSDQQTQDPKMNAFNPLVLNGTTDHAAMMNSYVSAVGQLMGTIAGLPAASNPVAIVDLQNEAYYQMEQYFCTDWPKNLISIARLGTWANPESANCDKLTADSPPQPGPNCTGCLTPAGVAGPTHLNRL